LRGQPAPPRSKIVIASSPGSDGIDRPRDAGYHRVVHCSIWTWRGDPDDLAARYEMMVASVPVESMRFSACAKVPDGIVVFDTCPSKSVFDEFSTSDGFRGLLEAHGLDAPESVVDGPAVVAFVDGQRVDLD
jgi:hypothetical protein